MSMPTDSMFDESTTSTASSESIGAPPELAKVVGEFLRAAPARQLEDASGAHRTERRCPSAPTVARDAR